MYLLDTNAWISYFRAVPGVVTKVAEHRNALCLSTLVQQELLVGAYRSQNPAKNLQLFADAEAHCRVIPFDVASAVASAKLAAELLSVGQRIGTMDSLIAGVALAHNLILVTHNTREFSRVQGLTLEDWES